MKLLIASKDDFFVKVAQDLLHKDHELALCESVARALEQLESSWPDAMLV